MIIANDNLQGNAQIRTSVVKSILFQRAVLWWDDGRDRITGIACEQSG